MILSLLAGLILGALSVVFALQNVAVVTVSFLSWEITGPLAFILLGTLISGGVISLLVLLPSIIRDELNFSALQSRKDALEKENMHLKVEMHERASIAAATTHTVI
ncbi:MAG: LapA family protein [Acetobacteraceae bacterium]|nr:LapA family protein [Acetobacteraceae bacterium]